MIRALVTGSLYGPPQARTSQAGKPYVTAKVRADGKHAAESGMDLKAYAEKSGKDRSTLARKLMAWRVLAVCHMAHKKKGIDALMDHRYGNGDEGEIYRHSGAAAGLLEDARDSWRNLAEIHAAPPWLWSGLVKAMIEGGWTVAVTRDKVGAFKDVAEPPKWADSNRIAEALMTGQMKLPEVAKLQKLVDNAKVSGEFRARLMDALESVTPARLLTEAQRGWIKTNLPALVAAVSAPCWRWCIEYPRHAVAADSEPRCVADYVPDADWRTVSSDYPGAAVWPAPGGLDVAGWIDAGRCGP